jgi:hypothetical protein
MIKRILICVSILALLCSDVFAWTLKNNIGMRMSNSKNGRPAGIPDNFPVNITKDITFYADYENGGVDAEYAKGSKTSTFTVTRATGPKPATYIDASGVIQSIATDNTPRINSCLYDSTGLLTNKKGLMVESSGTNLLQDSYFADGTTTYWRARG